MVKYYEGAATEEGHERAGHGSGAPFGWGGGAGRATINQGEPAETLELETEEA